MQDSFSGIRAKVLPFTPAYKRVSFPLKEFVKTVLNAIFPKYFLDLIS